MMKWAKERDSLIAQTRAFVNSVIVWKADAPPPADPLRPVAIENPFALTPRDEPEQIAAAETPERTDIAAPAQPLPIAELPVPRAVSPASPSAKAVLREHDERQTTAAPSERQTATEEVAPEKDEAAQNDVRKEIQSRVAAFQAHQRRFAKEREAYFNSVLTKARSAINGHDDDNGRDTNAT
jgi:hypothetical protein